MRMDLSTQESGNWTSKTERESISTHQEIDMRGNSKTARDKAEESISIALGISMKGSIEEIAEVGVA